MEMREKESLNGLFAARKHTPASLLYDMAGLELFDRICETKEYYPFRAEIGLLHRYAHEMAEELGPSCGIVELGSGASIKTRLLLDELEVPQWYMPVDVSQEALDHTRLSFKREYPDLTVLPICTDFMDLRNIATSLPPARGKIGIFFPGSTIGNLETADALTFLTGLSKLVGPGGMLIVGVDLLKESSTIEAAYNDGEGVTAQFNLNLLKRLNREFQASFEIKNFSHRAVFNSAKSRVEMHLVSLRDHWVKIGDQKIFFRRHESIHTESSYKYALEDFERMARAAGFRVWRKWMDERSRFCVFGLTGGHIL